MRSLGILSSTGSVEVHVQMNSFGPDFFRLSPDLGAQSCRPFAAQLADIIVSLLEKVLALS